MNDFSESALRADCPHCDAKSFALEHPLLETSRFWVVCDVHPLCEGHILIIPKSHLSCIGEYDQVHLHEFTDLYTKFTEFIREIYGSCYSFEHGKLGQTVFHSHVHLLPFSGKLPDIVPEGRDRLRLVNTFSDLQEALKTEGGYLFIGDGQHLYTVDPTLAAPRFFRDRFASALGHPGRGAWKKMHTDQQVMKNAASEILATERKWDDYSR